jgi:2-methylcitrate dehydratase PrpD
LVLAEFTADVDGARLPAPVVEISKMCLLDWLGSAIGGSRMPPGPKVLSVVEMLGGNPQATLVPGGQRLPVTSATLYNGAVSHIVELDDVHRGSILHPAAPIIPAALACAELVGASGSDFLAAVVAGYEVGIRIGESVTPSHYRYWHTTGTCGTFGAAAASAKLLGLDAAGIASALGSAGTQAAGLWEFLADGAMSKHLHPGKAAMNGILSALLAREGFTAATRILEGERGFFRAMAAEYDASRIQAGLGESYKILENSFKVHASCRHTHPAIDVVLDLVRQRPVHPEDVASVRVETYSVALDITAEREPKTLYSAKFSLPFCVALAICRKSASLVQFNDENLNNREIRELMQRVELVVDPALEARYPARWPARVTLRFKDGASLSGETEAPRGDPENPLTTADFEEKFRGLSQPVVGSELAEELIPRVHALDTLSDIGELTRCFSNPRLGKNIEYSTWETANE